MTLFAGKIHNLQKKALYLGVTCFLRGVNAFALPEGDPFRDLSTACQGRHHQVTGSRHYLSCIFQTVIHLRTFKKS